MKNEKIVNLISNVAIEHSETMKHSVRCSYIIEMFSDYLGFDEETKEILIKGSLIHDIGKFEISPDILYSTNKLSKEEMKLIKTHADNILIEDFMSNATEDMIKMQVEHHEKIDGSGYPKGLKNNEISLCGKIMMIIDIFDALYSKRSYKEPFSLERVISIFEEEKGKTLDNTLTDLFIKFLKDNISNINNIDFSQ